MPDQKARPSDDHAGSPEARSTTELSAAISSALVRLIHEHTGRGPRKAQTTISGDLVVTLLEGSLTKGERGLAEGGGGKAMLEGRRTYQGLMRDDAMLAVAELTGRRVVAFFNDTHAEPDMAVQVFVLEPRTVALAR